MKDWFDSLNQRERQFVLGGAVIVAISLIYGLAWAPFDKQYKELEANIVRLERAIVDLRSIRVILKSGNSSGSALVPQSQQSPIIIVDQTLRSRGLDRYRKRSQPSGSNGIRVEFENVAFDELVIWLGDLVEQHAMHVQNGSFSVGVQATPGRINASLTLERVL
ncbi:MAG: type II secretion system protein GspM [Woeseiaceae bacterium]|nr:type II secretion system protein GspM [Woeseiaceae bacterium]|tara:strand:- start:217 stop:708 length:492 start_codon:yes stop_codon:yes gene_type:complete